MTPAHAKVLSNTMAVAFASQQGWAAVRAGDLEILDAEELEVSEAAPHVELPGNRLRAAADVRKFLLEVPPAQREDPALVLVAGYDPQKDVTVLGLARHRGGGRGISAPEDRADERDSSSNEAAARSPASGGASTREDGDQGRRLEGPFPDPWASPMDRE